MSDRQLHVLALVTDSWGSEGGIGQFNRDLLEALAGLRSVRQIDVAGYRDAEPKHALPRNVSLYRANGSRLRLAGHCLRVAFSRRPDLVFCGHLHLAPLAAMVARIARAPLWLQLHGVDAWDRPSRTRRAAAESASLVTAVSRYTVRRFREWANIEPELVRVLPNTFGTAYRPGRPDADRLGRFGLASSDRFLLTVGRLSAAERYKGHDLVIPLMPALRALHPSLTYVVAGDGDDRTRLELLAAAHEVSDAVRFVGQVSADDLVDLYRAAAAFVMPSTGEGFGIAYLEALACGTPVVALASGGAVDPMRDGLLGRCVAPEALESALAAVLAAAPDRGSLASAVAAVFSRENQVSHAARLLEELSTRCA